MKIVHTRVYMCIYIHMYIHIFVYTCIYTYIYIYTCNTVLYHSVVFVVLYKGNKSDTAYVVIGHRCEA